MPAGDVSAGDLGGGLHHLLDGEPLAVTDVVDSAREVRNALKRKSMSLCDVHNVDIIPNASAIRRSIVRAIDMEAFALLSSHLQKDRNNVSFRTVIFAKSGRCACCVEIAHSDVFKPSTLSHFRKHTLEKEFGRTIGIYRIRGMVLGNRRRLRFAIGGRRRGEK